MFRRKEILYVFWTLAIVFVLGFIITLLMNSKFSLFFAIVLLLPVAVLIADRWANGKYNKDEMGKPMQFWFKQKTH